MNKRLQGRRELAVIPPSLQEFSAFGGTSCLRAAFLRAGLCPPAEERGGTAAIAARHRGDVLILDSADARSNFRVVSEKGSRLPIHCTSQGKLLLAYMPSAQRRALLRNCDFAAYTPHSHTDLASLEGEMEQILRQGYAIENGELRIGLRSVAAPVFNVEGQAQYAVCVVGMFRRVNSPELERATQLLLNAAERISFDLGYRGRQNP